MERCPILLRGMLPSKVDSNIEDKNGGESVKRLPYELPLTPDLVFFCPWVYPMIFAMRTG